MKLLDINLLVCATNEATAQHARARSWFEEIMSGAKTVTFPWHILIGFVRLTTRRAVMDALLTADRAIDYVQEWLTQPCATTVHPTYRHLTVLRELLNAVGTAGNRVPDAGVGQWFDDRRWLVLVGVAQSAGPAEVAGVGLVQLPAALVLQPMIVAAGVHVQQIHCTRAPDQHLTGEDRSMRNVPTTSVPAGRPRAGPCCSMRWTAWRSLTVSVPA